MKTVARILCLRVNGDAPDGYHAAHSCGNGLCVNPNHIRWASPSENQADRIGHGTSNRGSRNGNAFLTQSDVIAIKTLAAGSTKQAELAKRFHVSRSTISSIIKGKNWGWVQSSEEALAREYLIGKIPAGAAS